MSDVAARRDPPVVAAIVPAHNEEKTVGGVVRALVASGAFREVIVVSDGSTDGTAAAARGAGATLVHSLPRSRGKGAALSHGVMHTDAPLLAFFDADLVGFTAAHVAALLRPVTEGGAFMHVGLRDRGPLVNAVQRCLPHVSGERVLRREIFDAIPTRYLEGYGVEVALNAFCRYNRLPVGSAVQPGVSIVTKVAKFGLARALPRYLRMWAEAGANLVRVAAARRQFVERGTHMSHRHR